MAKIVTESVVITFSRIIKDSDVDQVEIVSAEIQSALEQVSQELVGNAIVVEVSKV